MPIFKTELKRFSGKTFFDYVAVGTLKKIKIPLPPPGVQKEIVVGIEKEEEEIIDANKRLVEMMEGETNKPLNTIL